MSGDAGELVDLAETVVAAEAATAAMEGVWPSLLAAIALWHRDVFCPAVHDAERAGVACTHHELSMAATLLQAAADSFAQAADETPCRER